RGARTVEAGPREPGEDREVGAGREGQVGGRGLRLLRRGHEGGRRPGGGGPAPAGGGRCRGAARARRRLP
ncbi:unnamed protein product, partial [Prorocentrum cordatum]